MTTNDKVTKSVTSKRKPPEKGGSRKGIPNKITGEVKTMILEALAGAGGVDYLISKADSHPAAFLSLVGKVLPLQVTGADGADMAMKLTVEYVRPKNPAS